MQESQTEAHTKKKYACATCGDEFEQDSDICPFDGTKLTVIAQQLAPGTVLGGRFEIIEALAGGGMGTVYKAHHKLMKRTVAIKTILPALVSSGAALKRFQHESQALSALSHPNILSVFDFFIDDSDGQPYLVMDFLEGTNLEAIRVSQGPMPFERAVGIFKQACAGLGHAHKHGIIHRDIKPSNIMLVHDESGQDNVKIVDFGIAKVHGESEASDHLTATGDTFGSPQYMSPEQCRAQPLDARSDIYSLGCVMYATLTGTPPFGAGDQMECMYNQVHTEPKRFCESSDCPGWLQKIVFKAMAKKLEDRWQSMDELAKALDGPTATDVSACPAGSNLPQRRSISPVQIGVIAVVGLALIIIGVQIGHRAPSTKHAPMATSNVIPSPTTSGSPPAKLSLPATGNVVATTSNTPVQTPEQLYASNMAAGKKCFEANDFDQAKPYFDAAHKAAEAFGESDNRYLESLEWQAKVAYKLGDTVQAHQAMEYIREVRKR